MMGGTNDSGRQDRQQGEKGKCDMRATEGGSPKETDNKRTTTHAHPLPSTLDSSPVGPTRRTPAPTPTAHSIQQNIW